jgi:hypothetical protein
LAHGRAARRPRAGRASLALSGMRFHSRRASSLRGAVKAAVSGRSQGRLAQLAQKNV